MSSPLKEIPLLLRFAGKDKVVLEFFRDKDVMLTLYDYYYAPEASGIRGNEEVYAQRVTA